MFCFNCLTDQPLTIFHPHYAISFTDGKLYKTECPNCGARGETTEARIANFNNSLVEQQLFLEGNKRNLPPLPDWNGRARRRPIDVSGTVDPNKGSKTGTTK